MDHVNASDQRAFMLNQAGLAGTSSSKGFIQSQVPHCPACAGAFVFTPKKTYKRKLGFDPIKTLSSPSNQKH